MPTVPDLYPTERPSMQGIPEVNPSVPVDAFGGAVGHAISGLGGAIEQASDRIWQRAVDLQNLNNETEAKNADAKYMAESGKLHEDFINKQGVNARPEALQAHIKELQDLRTNIRSELSNPMAQKMYDASSLGFMGRNIFNAAGHSGQQMNVAANNASDARIALAKTTIGDNPDDEINVSRMQRVIESETEAKGRNSGWTPEQIEATKQKEVSEAIGYRIIGTAKTNAPKAQRMLDEAIENKSLTPDIANKVQATVQTQFRDQGSRIISDRVLGDRRNGDEENRPVQEYIDEGLKQAKDMGVKDPLFPDFVRNRIIADYNRQHAIETDSDNMNVRTIGQALNKGNAEGALPTTLEELKAIDPAVGPAWDAIARDPKKQQAVLKQLQNNAKGERVVTTPENLQQFHTYRGQALAGTDEERAAFMAHSFGTESKLTLSQRNSLMSLQDQLRHRAAISAADDPRTSRALRLLKPDLEAAGITTTGGPDQRKDYFTFVGSLQDQLDQFQKDHPGKVPTMEEVRTMGAQLMQEQHTHWWQSSEKFYQTQIPDEELAKLRDDPYWKKRNITPNDSMLARIWRAQQFKDRYGGSVATGKPTAAFPPNAPEGGNE